MPDTADPAATIDALAGPLISRLIHDLMGPATGLMTGVSLLDDAATPRGEAVELISTSLHALIGLLNFCRAAYGAGDEPLSSGELGRLAASLFEGARPSLDWAVTLDSLPAVAGRTLLGLVQVAAGALAAGGTATATAVGDDAQIRIAVEARGARLRLADETVAGLMGRACEGGRIGQWAPACYLARQVVAAGGRLSTHPLDAGPLDAGIGGLRFEAVFPA